MGWVGLVHFFFGTLEAITVVESLVLNRPGMGFRTRDLLSTTPDLLLTTMGLTLSPWGNLCRLT